MRRRARGAARLAEELRALSGKDLETVTRALMDTGRGASSEGRKDLPVDAESREDVK